MTTISEKLSDLWIKSADSNRTFSVENWTVNSILSLFENLDVFLKRIFLSIELAKSSWKFYCDIEINKNSDEFIFEWNIKTQNIYVPIWFKLFCCYWISNKFYIRDNWTLENIIEVLQSEYWYKVFIVYIWLKFYLRIDWDIESNTVKRMDRKKSEMK